MASSIQLLRSTNPQERPFAGNLLEGQPAVNLHSSEPGLFFKATDGSIVKVGPASITSDGAPPNASAAGSVGNSAGEMWLDKSLDPPVLKVYDGAAWVEAGSGGGGGGGGSVTLLRWTKTAIGGETSLSGPDDIGLQLNYTPGLEQLYLNGVLLERGTDYVGTNGTSFTSLSPLTAGDVVMVLAYSPVSVAVLDASVISYTQSSSNAVERTVKGRLNDIVSVKDFGAMGNGSDDDTQAILDAASTGKSVYFPQGIYKFDGENSVSSAKWYANGDATIQFTNSGRLIISGSGTQCHFSGLTFKGTGSDTQYTDGVSGSTIASAFNTPEFINASGNVYDGADFTHTLSGDVWTLSLASLSGNTNRAFQSGFITLDENKRYVLHSEGPAVTQYGCFERVIVRRYDSAGSYLGDFNPKSSANDKRLQNTAKIKVRIILRRTDSFPVPNDTTLFIPNRLRVFELINEADTPSSAPSSIIWVGLKDAIIENCVFEYMPKELQTVLCERIKFINNWYRFCENGISVTNCKDSLIESNLVDLRFKHTNGLLYNKKYNRAKCLTGFTDTLAAPELHITAIRNIIRGADWGLEFYNPNPNFAPVHIIKDNIIYAESQGLSLHGATDSIVSGNVIAGQSSWGFSGYEIVGAQKNVTVSDNYYYLDNWLDSVNYGINPNMNPGWEKGVFCRNYSRGPIGIYSASQVTDTDSTIIFNNNDVEFNGVGAFLQNISNVRLSGNTFKKIGGSSVVSFIESFTLNNRTYNNNPLVIIKDNYIESGIGGALTNKNGPLHVENNHFFASRVQPLLLSKDNFSITFINNHFTGSTPTQYIVDSGSGENRWSLGNTKDNAQTLSLGRDKDYSYTTTTTGDSSLQHTVNIGLPSAFLSGWSSVIANILCQIGGDSNNLVSATFLISYGPNVTHDLNSVQQLGATSTSNGSPVVGSATITANRDISTNTVSFVITQSGGSPGQVGTSYVKLSVIS